MSSSRKRSRNANDIDGEGGDADASSVHQHSQSKRSRMSFAEDNASEEENNDSGYAEDNFIDETDLPDMDDDDDDRVDELRATQAVEKQMNLYRENIASEAGVVEEIFCRNFMCHTKLRVRLGPLINFIIGHNGSGKSAVLTALTMCLGGSARSSNRGKKLESMIKEGQDSGMLAVKIKNQGDGAYRPEMYGESITIERHFARGRGGGYKIKNAEDKVVGTKQVDVQAICDFFAFQLDNPINVLSQDMARQFLSNSSPSDKYKFFMRGTQLETLDNDYNQMEELLDSITAKLSGRTEDITVLEDRFKKAERKKQRLDDVRKIDEKIRKVHKQHAWAQVGEEEEKLARYTENVAAGHDAVREKEEAAEASSGLYDGHDQAHEAATHALEQAEGALTPVEERFNNQKEAYTNLKAQLTETHTEEKSIREHMKKARTMVQNLENDVEIETARIANAEGDEHGARLQRLEELKTTVNAVKEEETLHKARHAELARAKDEAARAYEKTRQPLEQERDALGNAERKLTEMQRSQARPLAGYRPNMELLVRAVDSETRWRHKPVGPMGRHVRLLKPEWSSQIEKTFGAALESFVVTNSEDQRLFREISRRARCDVPVLIGRPERLDTTGNVPEDTSIDTILSVLNIDNDLVWNQLIIHHAIEQTWLISEYKKAYDLLYSGPRPRNVKVAISFANKPGSGTRQDWSRTGQQRSSGVGAWTGTARMHADREQQIQHQRQTLNQHKIAVDNAEKINRETQNVMVKADQQVTAWTKKARELKTAVQVAEDAVEGQNNLIESTRPQDGKLQELQRQVTEAKEELITYQASFQDAQDQKDKLSQQSKNALHVLNEVEKELKTCKAQLAKAKDRAEKLQDDRTTALLAKNEALEAIDAVKKHLEVLERKRDGQQTKVEMFVAEASKVSLRIAIEPGMTPARLDQMSSELTKQLKRQEELAGGDRVELTLAWQKAKSDYDTAQSQLAEMENLSLLLGRTLGYRRSRWQKFRKHIAMRSRTIFQYLLSERKFRGNMILDHRDKTLDISVEPDSSKTMGTRGKDGREGNSGREARTLSGGEKSFSTICLLLSIWEAMGSPLRCLDEFDVFMDSVNRATSMGMMIGAARRAVGRQFVLITPQAMGNVTLGDDVKVHKMSDPERGQGVLPFTQAA
ncbi:hypothetical protein LTR62_001688 [Meristemomyces frigidus]|uniref:RecF/RecN/SMC N-terminal domain-containing protein n=1 Tax=Meristemomyces frigidus TaxID=1508187 RepID=A0AAN7T8U8_9PEZI|nr:hypothetical protein LTR62_001688 [Meristemomyces frigidus]